MSVPISGSLAAPTMLNLNDYQHTESDAPRRRIVLKTIKDLRNQPRLSWLIDEILPARGFTILYGDGGSYKTFCALDMALSIGTGSAWQGRQVRAGSVIYILGEGDDGFQARIDAWCQYRGTTVGEGFKIIDEPIVFTDPRMVDDLCHTIDHELTQAPNLVIIDTLARCFGAGDENSTQDMNQFVQGVDRLRSKGSTVLIIHHQPKSGKATPRGNNALSNAANTTIHAVRIGIGGQRALKLTCQKQRDGKLFTPIELVSREVQLKEGGSTLVFDRVGPNAPQDKAVQLEQKQQRFSEYVLREIAANPMIGRIELQKRLNFKDNRPSYSKLVNTLKHLERVGKISYREEGQGGRFEYFLTQPREPAKR
ncbi:MAG TPA: AAA family ATPase [Thermomicrobiaceae bacterium]|nr:AAA family ATPase [Thermomicrobiaceae bacterium]